MSLSRGKLIMTHTPIIPFPLKKCIIPEKSPRERRKTPEKGSVENPYFFGKESNKKNNNKVTWEKLQRTYPVNNVISLQQKYDVVKVYLSCHVIIVLYGIHPSFFQWMIIMMAWCSGWGWGATSFCIQNALQPKNQQFPIFPFIWWKKGRLMK